MSAPTKIIEIPLEFKRLFDTDWREAAVYGGRYSLKSHTAARVLLLRARSAKVRVACFREFQNSISESSHQLLSDLIDMYEMTDFKVTDNAIINTVTGSDFLFKGLRHNEQSIKSLEGIDIAWVEEAQTISSRSLEVLTPTIRKPGSQIIYTYNRLLEEDPVHTRLVIEGRPNTLVIHVNYDVALKRGWMPEVIRLEMEDDKVNRPNLYRYKWLGEPNTMEGRIYTGWIIIDEIPHEAKLERRGLDFGYSKDPAALIDIYKYNGGFILNERFYQLGMSNRAIAEYISNCEESQALVYADSSEPKSIDEVAMYGIPIVPAQKGPGSINQGIRYIQDQRISVTRRSKNLISEYMNYQWAVDKEEKVLNKPEDINNHLMDALRYGLETYHYHRDRQTGIVLPRGLDNKQGSFMANEDGTVEAESLHIDVAAAIKRQSEDDRSWQYR